jgi:DNA-binding NarL/FixJ family response regulator
MRSHPTIEPEQLPGSRESGRLSRPARVLIVDDHPGVRAGLEGVLLDQADLVVVGMAANANDALAEAERLSPRVAIVDYHLPGRDGLSLTRQLKRLHEPPAVLIYSAFADARLTLGALVAGADGVTKKSSRADELCAALRAVANGLRVMPRVPSEMTAIAAHVDAEDLPILGMLMNGVPPVEVAEVLGLTEEWLDIRRWAILERIGAPADYRRA